jgi:hypothetical protein
MPLISFEIQLLLTKVSIANLNVFEIAFFVGPFLH